MHAGPDPEQILTRGIATFSQDSSVCLSHGAMG